MADVVSQRDHASQGGEGRSERRLQYDIQSARATNPIGRENMKNDCRSDAAVRYVDKERSGHAVVRLGGRTT